MFYYFLLPNYIEQLLHISNSEGNMALHGVFLDIYNKRNFFYISLLSLPILYYYNNMRIGVISVFVTFCLFLQTYLKWKKIIDYNLTFKKE
jgi:hypothetical protein